jgi:hypothetical protein
MTRMVRSPISFGLLGLLLILLTALITLLIQCPSNSQVLSLYILFGTGIGLVFVKSVERSAFFYRLADIRFKLGGAVAFIFLLIWYNPIERYKANSCNALSVAVFVHGKKGKQDLILRQQGDVIMDVNGERKRHSIDENGQATFQNLHVGDEVRLSIDFSEPYHSLSPDSVYRITTDGRIYMAVALQGIDRVKGKVLTGDYALPGVSVQIDTLHTLTDSSGFFMLIIPEALQASQYQVWFSKQGYHTVSINAFPQTGLPVLLMMTEESVFNQNEP